MRLTVLNRLAVTFIMTLVSVISVYSSVKEVAPGVFMYQAQHGCNSGWIVFKDYVLVIDTQYPSFAEKTLPIIAATTDKPVRFVLNTNHQEEHSFGNGIFTRDGATVISHRACFEALRNAEDQYQEMAEGNLNYQNLGLVLPSIVFDDRLVLEDGERRVELIFPGHGHSSGNAVAYLPKEKVLFTGDLCINGQLQSMKDADTENWIKALTRLQAFDVETVCPGYGEVGSSDLLKQAKDYLTELRKQVLDAVLSGKSFDETYESVSVTTHGKPARRDHVQYIYKEIAGLVTPWKLKQLGLYEGPNPTTETPGWTPPKKFLLRNVDERGVAALELVAPEVEFINVRNDREAMDVIASVDGMMGPISQELFKEAGNLKWVHSRSAGVEGYLFPEFINSGVVLTNGQAMFGEAIGEHVMGMILMLTKTMTDQYKQQLKGEWNWVQDHRNINLKGRTMLVLGLGGIGRQVAERAAGFGMRILAIDPYRENKPNHVEAIYPPDQLNDVLPEADVVVCCVPHTKYTHRYFGKEQFDRMKPEAYFVNIARGEVIVQEDLVQALENKSIAGAALDVTDPEPLPDGHPLWSMDNVVITPHMSGKAGESNDYVWLLLRENIRRFAEGELLYNVVNKSAGY